MQYTKNNPARFHFIESSPELLHQFFGRPALPLDPSFTRWCGRYEHWLGRLEHMRLDELGAIEDAVMTIKTRRGML